MSYWPVTTYTAKHWAYTAAVMADAFKGFFEKKRADPGEVPVGVRHSAEQFFAFVMRATRNDVPPLHDEIHAYHLALQIANQILPVSLRTFEEANACLGRYARFIKGLPACGGPLTEEELSTVDQLQKFFVLLQQRGEAERMAPSVDDE